LLLLDLVGIMFWLGTMGSRAGKIRGENGSTSPQAEEPSVAKGVPTQVLPDLCSMSMGSAMEVFQ
jgi:hypothetical protein